MRDGIRAMYHDQQDCFYYITLTNQAYPMPPLPEGVEEGVLRGMYCFERQAGAQVNHVRQRRGDGGGAAGAGSCWRKLRVASNVWSVTQLQRGWPARPAKWSGARLLQLGDCDAAPYVQSLLAKESGVFVAASDYMKALPGMISPWVPGPYTVLGTDGFGLSESRDRLRDYFEVSGEWVASRGACQPWRRTTTRRGRRPWSSPRGMG